MGQTQWRGYPRVDVGEPPDGRAQINALADAIDADVQRLATGMRVAEILHYTSSGIFEKGRYPGLRGVLVDCLGGGGGSGYIPAVGAGEVAAGAGGGAGAYTRSWFTASDLPSVVTVTVGAGGAGGTSGSPTGIDGGTSSFGSLVSAGGGTGGQSFGPISQTDGSTATVLAVGGGLPDGSYLIGVAGDGTGPIRWDSLGAGQPAGFSDLRGIAGAAPAGGFAAPNNASLAVRLPRTEAINLATAPTTPTSRGHGAHGGVLASISGGGPNGSAAGGDGLVIVWVFIS